MSASAGTSRVRRVATCHVSPCGYADAVFRGDAALPIERADVAAPLWRKKVDGSLVRLGYTPLPMWVANMWSVPDRFSSVHGRGDPSGRIACSFAGASFTAEIVPHRGARQFRLFLQEELRIALSRTFPMSYMRELEVRLAASDTPGSTRSRDHDTMRAFWEFVDLEYDADARHLRIIAHYVQRPDFPHLFARLIDSTPLRRIDDELRGKGAERIHKHPWRPRARYESEIAARNVVYMLADCVNGLLYVGEADDMVARFRRGHPPIPEWTHYRYDVLPHTLAPERLALERMTICDIDAIVGRWAEELPTPPGGFRMANTKIDR